MRKWIANWLVRIARKIDPPNEEAMKFYLDRISEAMITGSSFFRISAVDKDEVIK